PPVIKALRNYSTLPFDVHLMISPVHKYIKDYADAGADIITIHPEATDNLEESINLIKKLNKKIGLSLNPDTPINIIKKFLPSIDLVLIMSVYPGFGGQKFIPKVIDKIKELKNIKEKQNIKFDIEVDGGIDFDNSKLVVEAGANILVSGTTIFKNNNGDIKKNIETLKSI
nr:ribulose-phosphate 3-epimerase [Pelagibacterales bacterium]